MATAAAAAVAVARRKVLGYFFERNAVTPDSGVMFATERRLQQRQFDQFVHKGVIRESKPGIYYVDVPAWNAWQRGLHNRLKIVLLIVVLMLGAVLLFTAGKG